MKKIFYALTCTILVTVACGTSSIAPTLEPNELQTVIVSTALAAQIQTQIANAPAETSVTPIPAPTVITVPTIIPASTSMSIPAMPPTIFIYVLPTVAPMSSSYPAGITAICSDGTYSDSTHVQGTCSRHGGVKTWIYYPLSSANTPVVPIVAIGDAAYLPNPVWQPGADNPNVAQDNIQSTICVTGYTSTIRPPVSYTDNLKVQQIKQYEYTDTNPVDYEEDHLIPLEVGGDPANPKNLWPEPRYSAPYNASTKDILENTLHKMVCDGQLPLDTARQAIATDWVAAYRQYVGQSIISVTSVPTEP
jgi:Protein of unknown function (DUF3761)